MAESGVGTMTEWNEPNDPPLTGHAAVGFVVGQRYDDGERPEEVLIKYLDEDGHVKEASVFRDSTRIQQVEFDETDTARFLLTDWSTLEVNGIVSAKPVGVSPLEEAYEDYVPAMPLPEDHELEDAECHNCGEPWDEDEWDVRHINAPDTMGETWKYQCPGCGHETFEAGT